MKIVWSKKAVNSLQIIYDYLAEQSPEAADKVANEILDKADAICPYPDKHQIEEKLGAPFRYALYSHYKIIFRPYYNTVRIYKVFDTRQNPSKLK
jgi:plasmid stabilization system protein ParE